MLRTTGGGQWLLASSAAEAIQPCWVPPCSYEVRKKKKGCVEEIAQLIVEKFTTKPQPGNKRSWRVQVGGGRCR